MKKVISRLVILFLIFVGCVIGFSIQMNRGEAVQETELAEASLPVLYMQVAGHTTNRMAGHVRAIDERSERSSLTPLASDRTLTLQIRPYENRIDGVSYQVTRLSDGEVMENGRVSNFTDQDDLQTAAFTLNQPIEAGREYMLRFAVEMEGREPVYYYTRLMQAGNLNVRPFIEFATAFTAECVAHNADLDINSWLETTHAGSSGGLEHLTLEASEEQLRWGTLAPEIYRRGTVTIEEVNDVTTSLSMEYTLRCEREEGVEEFYEVTDFFRLRQDQETIFLLDFDRTAARVFDGTNARTEQGIDLGLQHAPIRIYQNVSGSRIAFPVGGDLWAYDHEAGQLTRIFTFREADSIGDRAEDRRHGVRVVHMDDSGNILFTIYGYMPAGEHEGENGLGIYQYNAADDLVEETVFFPLEQSYELMNTSLSRLVYANSQKEIFLLLGTDLCCVDPVKGTFRVVQSGLQPEYFFSSESQRTVAWMDPQGARGSERANVLDLETGRTNEVTAGSGEKVYGIGFINEDFVYGYANTGDILIDRVGNVTPGLARVLIRSIDGTVVKEYSKDGLFVTDTAWEGENLWLELSSRTDTGFAVDGEDHIVNNVGKEEEILLISDTDARTRSRSVILFEDSPAEELLIEFAMFRNIETDDTMPEMQWPAGENTEYFVYGRGKLQGIYDMAGTAVRAADTMAGTVLNSRQEYVWERGDWPATARMNPNEIPEAMKNTPLDEAMLADALGEGYQVLNLSGSSSESLFYRLGKGGAVLAAVDNSDTMLLVGYDAFNFWYYQGEGQDAKAIATDDARELFERNGNVFLSYLEG